MIFLDFNVNSVLSFWHQSNILCKWILVIKRISFEITVFKKTMEEVVKTAVREIFTEDYYSMYKMVKLALDIRTATSFKIIREDFYFTFYC